MKFVHKGKLVTIRPPEKGDAEDIYKNITRDVAMNTFIPWPYSIQDARDFIKLSKKNREKKVAYTFAIVPHEIGRVVGMVGLQDIRPKHSRVEIGYWLSKKHRGKGYVTEAVMLALKFAFKELKFNRVQTHTTLRNIASRKVMERCGFTYEGTLRKYEMLKGKLVDIVMFSMLKSEYKARTKKKKS